MSKLPVCNMAGSQTGEFDLADEILEVKRGAQAVHEVVVAHQAKRRAGTASTLKRGEVSGGGAKPWRQKGTGRARAGSNRSPIWRGGGITFGPKPRSYEKQVNKKVRQLAFRRAFSEKVAAGDVILLDRVELAEPKTKLLASVLKKVKAGTGALIVCEKAERNLLLASRNLEDVEVVDADGVHTYQLLRYPKVVVARAAMEKLAKRLGRAAGRAS